ncbi:MAG: fused MFS/spermidine synthase [Deltaproteobacteria bacterium]|nr:fused MFS/spermidine synthase [Deltaproteobacteria bacterium]
MLTRFRITALLFLTSGATALLYQVAFGKKLSTIYGATAYAVSAVLAAFMGGLALGAHLGGKWASKVRRPLFVYGVAEALVGVVCALTPLFFDGVAGAYRALVVSMPSSLVAVTVIRAVLTATVVIVPTIAMGITMPMLARALAGTSADDGAGAKRRLSALYAANTLGGALGAVISAYVVLPTLGLTNTMRAAAVVNLAIGVIAMRLGGAEVAATAGEAPTEEEAKVPAEDLPEMPLYALLALASGVLVFGAEVVDTHLLALLIGNSAYAFGLMLAVFLTCLGAGAGLAGLLERRLGPAALPVALAAVALALVATLPVFGYLTLVFIWIGGRVDSWAGRELVRGLVAFVALVVPTVCMGLTYPMLLRRLAARADVGRRVGQLTAINTFGSIVGSLAFGYAILPGLGSERTLKLIAGAFAGLAVLAAVRQQDGKRFAFGSAAATMVGVLLMPPWDMKVMTNGANVYFGAAPPPDELVYVAEDVHGGLTSVARRGEVLTMYTNGKFQGDNGWEITAQRSFAHFPSLFVSGFERVLVVGLGTGTTLGTVEAYPYKAIDVAEISPAIVESARRFFDGPNRNALDDKRVNLVLNDGRNHLLITPHRYDLITIELSSVWFAGSANLYSREFYELCRDRLTERGILQQWLQLHHIHRRELAAVLRTLHVVFPHAALFVGGNQGIIVASQSPLVASRQLLDQLGARDGIRDTLGGVKLEDLLGRMVLSGPEFERFIEESEGGGLVSTDDNLYLEYATPKGNVLDYDVSIRGVNAMLDGYATREPAKRHLGP